MEQILLAYGIWKETVTAIMMLYRNTKVKVCSPDGETDYFDNVAGVLQRDTLAPYLFLICLDYVLRTFIDKIKENSSKLTKERRWRYPAKTITDADYGDDIALLASAPAQAETMLHRLKTSRWGTSLHVNAHKTEYMCFNQTDDISTLNSSSLKLHRKPCLVNRDRHRHVTSKGMDCYERLLVVWKSDLTNKMKHSFFQTVVVSILLYWCTTWKLTKSMEKKLDGNYTRMLRAILIRSWRQHTTNLQLYCHLPPIAKTIRISRTRHAGHYWRSRDELIIDVLLRTLSHGRTKLGRPARTYILQLWADTGYIPEDLPETMDDKDGWWERVRDIPAGAWHDDDDDKYSLCPHIVQCQNSNISNNSV